MKIYTLSILLRAPSCKGIDLMDVYFQKVYETQKKKIMIIYSKEDKVNHKCHSQPHVCQIDEIM